MSIPEKVVIDSYREGEGFKNKEGCSGGEAGKEHGRIEDGEVNNHANDTNEGKGSDLIPTLCGVAMPPEGHFFFLKHCSECCFNKKLTSVYGIVYN